MSLRIAGAALGIRRTGPHFPPMSDNAPTVTVELSTPRGIYLAWNCSAVDLSSVNGSIAITPPAGSFLYLLKATRVTLRSGDVFFSYVLENATANLNDGRLIILAEEIRQIEPAENAAIPANHLTT